MLMSSLCTFELQRAYRLEKLDLIGKEIHFSNDLVGDNPFFLKKHCNHRGGDCLHEFNVYFSQKNGNVYFHRCDNCCYSIRITEDYYNKAKAIYDAGGTYID